MRSSTDGPIQVRKLATRLHRYVGLSLALFLVMVGLTGSFLVFQQEIDRWLNPHLFKTEPRDYGSHLAYDEATTRVERQLPGHEVSYVVPPRHAHDSISMRLRAAERAADQYRYDQAFANPFTGEVLGVRKFGACCLQRENVVMWIYKMHYTLLIPGRIGAGLLGIVALLWTLDCFVGFYLTLPKGRPFWRKWSPAWKVKRGTAAARTTFDLHRAGGLWLWGALLILASSGVYFNLHSELYKPLVSLISTPSGDPTAEYVASRSPNAPAEASVGFDGALATALDEAERRGWGAEVRGIFHRKAQQIYSVYLHAPAGLASGIGGPIVHVDALENRVVAGVGQFDGSAADVWFKLQFPLHSGQIAGLPGRLVVFLAGLITAMLSITGVLIWLRKRGWLRARKRDPQRPPTPSGQPATARGRTS